MHRTQVSELRHRQISRRLREEITGGRYRPGDRLPTEVELMQLHAVSRSTVTRALRDLEEEGVIRRRRGSGTFVSEQEATRSLAFLAPSATAGSPLPYVEGLIHQHLADLVGADGGTLALARSSSEAAAVAQLFATARGLARGGAAGVFYYPAELPAERMRLNEEVVFLLRDQGVPVVLIDRDVVAPPGRSAFDRIGFDNRRAGQLLTDHLIEVGCRRIAFVGIAEVSTAVTDRFAGYRDALYAHDIVLDPGLVRGVDDLSASVCRALLDHGRPDAILCKSDRFAALLGRHLTAMGVRIGTDVRLAGFDDDPIAELLPVPLTTVRLPALAFAEAAHEALRRRIAGPTRVPLQVVVDIELVVRESTSG